MKNNTKTMNILSSGVRKGYISFPDMPDYVGVYREDTEQQDTPKQICYIHQNKTRNFQNPEEQVEAEAFLRLIFDYGYTPKRIRLYVPVQMGAETKEADIIVYQDDDCLRPYILIECKRQDISEPEFVQAIEQAYSYAYALPNDIKYVWITSGLRNEYFEVDKQQDLRAQQPDIPQNGVKHLASYKYVYNAEEIPIEEGKQRFFDLTIIGQEELTRRFRQAHDALWGGGQ
ncbi:MAG: type I restriction enzyme HsdR N-terminal domain-containing protein, partial [Paludibacter sp.]|nr:type I restriction enzyme HsdR N-terminal domain-containing protein [Paludibacter sp.]